MMFQKIPIFDYVNNQILVRMSKKVRLEEQYPQTYATAQDIVARVKRALLKKTSVSKIATELVHPLNAFAGIE